MFLWENKIQDAVMIFLSIIAEAVPFILLGVLASAFLSHFIKKDRLLRFIPKNRTGCIVWAMLLGFCFPVCECGNVPVARKLLQKGVQPFIVTTFLLAAPVLNPIVLIATWSAFRFMPEIFYFRIVFAFAIAFLIGIAISYHPKVDEILAEKLKKNIHHDHETSAPALKIKMLLFFQSAAEEFFEMFKVLIIGAALSATIQFIIPRSLLLDLGKGPVTSIFTMIVFAVITAVCSNVDAFIALSYVNSFTPGSLLAFLTFGPLIDLKSFFMMRTVFNSQALLAIFSTILLLVLIFTLTYNFYAG